MKSSRFPTPFLITLPRRENLIACYPDPLYFHWVLTPALWEIETDEGFSLKELMQKLWRLEPQTLGYVKHGDVLREDFLS